MPLTFQAHITPALARLATRGIFWRQVWHWKVLAGAGSFLLGLLLVSRVLLGGAGWAAAGMLATLAGSSMLAAAWVVCERAVEQAARNFVRFEGAPATVRLAEGAYAFQAPWGSGNIQWRDFHSLWRFEAVWVLLQHKAGGTSVLLPTDAMDEEARDFVLARLSEAKVELK